MVLLPFDGAEEVCFVPHPQRVISKKHNMNAIFVFIIHPQHTIQVIIHHFAKIFNTFYQELRKVLQACFEKNVSVQ